ncbi:hypothetical protein [Paenibacillus durus]|uniref:Uncharacterized protein n=1 Tax=Paenibacillus durus TaxID=44251 RepID=A0A089HH89_PAEDU|nr:hypothetical protein [Paenibacillus durus]AIQ11316.1 hypothetical protein PDUR_04405 [Paenibacillus durus]
MTATDFSETALSIVRQKAPGATLVLHDTQQPIERYYYSLDSCRELFTDWNERSLWESADAYYGKLKVIIEGMFERVPSKMNTGPSATDIKCMTRLESYN